MKKLTYKEIERLKKDNYEEFDRFFYSEKKNFIFGIKHFIDNGCKILINRKISLRIATEPLSSDVEICPDDKRAGDVITHRWQVLFYVRSKEFEQFLKEAKSIQKEYKNFMRIPDVWFANTALVKFISKKVITHPKYIEIDRMQGHLEFGT